MQALSILVATDSGLYGGEEPPITLFPLFGLHSRHSSGLNVRKSVIYVTRLIFLYIYAMSQTAVVKVMLLPWNTDKTSR